MLARIPSIHGLIWTLNVLIGEVYIWTFKCKFVEYGRLAERDHFKKFTAVCLFSSFQKWDACLLPQVKMFISLCQSTNLRTAGPSDWHSDLHAELSRIIWGLMHSLPYNWLSQVKVFLISSQAEFWKVLLMRHGKVSYRNEYVPLIFHSESAKPNAFVLAQGITPLIHFSYLANLLWRIFTQLLPCHQLSWWSLRTEKTMFLSTSMLSHCA